MEYEIRLATADDIPPALDLAWRMFVRYDSLDLELNIQNACEWQLKID